MPPQDVKVQSGNYRIATQYTAIGHSQTRLSAAVCEWGGGGLDSTIAVVSELSAALAGPIANVNVGGSNPLARYL